MTGAAPSVPLVRRTATPPPDASRRWPASENLHHSGRQHWPAHWKPGASRSRPDPQLAPRRTGGDRCAARTWRGELRTGGGRAPAAEQSPQATSSTQVSATASPRTSIPFGEFRRIRFVVMPVHDQPRRRDLGQPVDRGEAVPMARRRLVRHQHVEAMLPQPREILREDRIAMP